MAQVLQDHILIKMPDDLPAWILTYLSFLSWLFHCLLWVLCSIVAMSSDQGSRVTAVTVCYIIPIPLEILATGLRIYAKRTQGGREKFTLDDFFIIFATVSGRPG